MASSNAYVSGAPPMNPGDPISATSLELMRQADQRALPARGIGVRIRQTPNGSIVTALNGRGRRATMKHPFRVAVHKKPPQGQILFKVAYGSVNGIEPQLSGKWLHNIQPEPPSLAAQNNSKIYLKANLDAHRAIVSAQIAIGNEVPDNTDGASHILIAEIFIVTTGQARKVTIAQNVFSSLGFRTCKNPWYNENDEDSREFEHIWWRM